MHEEQENSAEDQSRGQRTKKDPEQFREMIQQFNSNMGGPEWGGTQTIKFYIGSLYQTLQPWIDAGQSEFTIQFATYDSPRNASEYAERVGERVEEIVNKVTILIKNPGADDDYFEIGKVCPPPQNCD